MIYSPLKCSEVPYATLPCKCKTHFKSSVDIAKWDMLKLLQVTVCSECRPVFIARGKGYFMSENVLVILNKILHPSK